MNILHIRSSHVEPPVLRSHCGGYARLILISSEIENSGPGTNPRWTIVYPKRDHVQQVVVLTTVS